MSEQQGGGKAASAGGESHGSATPGQHAHASDQSHGATTAGQKAHASDQSKGVSTPGKAGKTEHKDPGAGKKDEHKDASHDGKHEAKDGQVAPGTKGELHKEVHAQKLAATASSGKGQAPAAAVSAGITTAGHLHAEAELKVGPLDIKAALDLDFGAKPKKPALNVPGLPGAPGKIGRPSDHQGGFNFHVDLEFDGIKAGAFRSVDGLAASVELIEYQGGGDKFARQIPGRPKLAPVVLKKGYVNTGTLWGWMKATMEGKMQLQNVSVVLLADDGQTELARYNLMETWPSSWKGWQLDANASNAMVEELELQVRSVERVQA